MRSLPPLDRLPRGLSVVFVRYDREKYRGAWSRLTAHLDSLAESSVEVVVVDNARTATGVEELSPGCHLITGSNSQWEFSAFDEGLDWLRDQGRLRDVTLLVTDAFGAYGEEFLDLIGPEFVRYCRRRSVAAGWIDSFDETCALLGVEYDAWLRSSYVLAPSAALEKVGPLAHPLELETFFESDWQRCWRSGAPLSDNLKRRIDHWLTGQGAEPASDGAETWHSEFDLSADTYAFFQAKACAVLREHHLSIRLREADVPLYDLRVLSDLLVRGAATGVAEEHQGFAGLQDLRYRDEGEVRLDGQRLLFVGDPSEGADLVAARRFSSAIMPLVLQRYPRATFELTPKRRTLAVAALAGVNNTRLCDGVESPSKDHAGVAARVGSSSSLNSLSDPGATGARPTVATRLRARAAEVESIVFAADGTDSAAALGDALAVAEKCCAAIERLEPPRSLPRTPEERPPEANEAPVVVLPEDDDAFTTVPLRLRVEYLEWRDSMLEEFGRRESYESTLVEGPMPFVIEAVCCACRRETALHVDFDFGGDATAQRPNWRERLVCQVCGLNSKMRGLRHALEEVVVPAPDAEVLVWALDDQLATSMASTYGRVVATTGDDATLPQGSAAFDSLLVIDMFERQSDVLAAIDRCFELLRPGGGMVFSANFATSREGTRSLPDGSDGELRNEFGWGLLQMFLDRGFEDVVAHFFWSRTFGYLGREQALFVARKPAYVG